MTTLADIDTQLEQTCQAYQQAIDDGRTADALALYEKLDALLEERNRTPHDR